MSRPKILELLVLITLGASIPLSAAQDDASNSLMIGLLLPPEEPQGLSVREGALFAKEQASKSVTEPVEVLIRGRVGQWGADATEAARMVIDDGAAGLIAPPDGAASHLVLQVSGRTAVPVVSLCADSSVSRAGVPWMLRVVPRTTEEAKALFTAIPAPISGHTNQWAALVPEGRAGREISRDLREAAMACGCRLDQTTEISSACTNNDTILAQALSRHPDALLLWLAPVPAGKMAKQLRMSAWHGRLAGPGRLRSPDFIAAAGKAVEGFLITSIVQTTDSSARGRIFQTAFQERWGHAPDPMAAMSYEAVTLLANLLKQREFQVPPHRLSSDFSWPGVTGELTFDPDGNRKVVLEVLEGGRNGFAHRT